MSLCYEISFLLPSSFSSIYFPLFSDLFLLLFFFSFFRFSFFQQFQDGTKQGQKLVSQSVEWPCFSVQVLQQGSGIINQPPYLSRQLKVILRATPGMWVSTEGWQNKH